MYRGADQLLNQQAQQPFRRCLLSCRHSCMLISSTKAGHRGPNQMQECKQPEPTRLNNSFHSERMQALHAHPLFQFRGLPARTSLHPSSDLRKSPDSCSRISLRLTAQSDSCESYQEPQDTVNRSFLLRQSAILAAGSATMGIGTSSAHAQPSPLQPTQEFQVSS